MTNYQRPQWLNPEFGPPEDLCRRLQAARDALAPIAEMVDEYNKDHGDVINEYHDWEEANDSPDGVWQLINQVTGYADLHAQLLNAAYVLDGPTERGVKKAIGRGVLPESSLEHFHAAQASREQAQSYWEARP